MRVGLGLLLLVAAEESRFPNPLRILGAITLVAAVAIALMGSTRLQRMIDWWGRRSPTLIRISLALALLFGLFLVFAVWRTAPA
jgi:hypothetical protein